MRTNGIILVEPGVHLLHGHYREKLGLWAAGFLRAGWKVSVACSQAPEQGFLPPVAFRSLSPRQKSIGRILPDRLQILWLVFRTYLMAFRHAKKTNEAVLGLTTSTLLPVAAARLLANARHIPFAQIVMYGNVFQESNLRLRRWIEAKMLISLLHSDAIVFPNTDHTRKSFLRQIRDERIHNRISTLYDPIYIPNISASASKKRGEEILLIPGPDDYRRTPLFHLRQANLVDPPRNVWIHAPGHKSEEILEMARFRFTYDLKISTEYRTANQFAELFVSATWCLLANRPDLGHASALLAQSIVAGTPVLCSRFPYSKEIFERFGRLGELFDFDDIDDFNSAWSKLRNWGSTQWQEFETASENFARMVNAEGITGQIVNYFTDGKLESGAR